MYSRAEKNLYQDLLQIFSHNPRTCLLVSVFNSTGVLGDGIGYLVSPVPSIAGLVGDPLLTVFPSTGVMGFVLRSPVSPFLSRSDLVGGSIMLGLCMGCNGGRYHWGFPCQNVCKGLPTSGVFLVLW